MASHRSSFYEKYAVNWLIYWYDMQNWSIEIAKHVRMKQKI